MKKLLILLSFIPALVFGQQNIKQVTTTGNNAGGNSIIGLSLIGLRGATSGTVTVTPPAIITTYTFTLPADDGTASQYLQTDGNGITSWATLSASTPTLTNTYVGFGASGILSGSNKFTFNNASPAIATITNTVTAGFSGFAFTDGTVTSGIANYNSAQAGVYGGTSVNLASTLSLSSNTTTYAGLMLMAKPLYISTDAASGGALGYRFDNTGFRIGTNANIHTANTVALEVAGALKFPTGASNGYILTSDASGNATWAAAPAPSGSAGGDLTGTYPNPTIKSAVALLGPATLTATPTTGDNSSKIANTAFVKTAIDNAIAGVNPAVAVQAATTANVSGYTYNNGVSGIGATLTQNSAAIVVIDGYTLLLNDRVLFKNQSTAANNGVYFISTLGTGIIPAVFTRALDYDMPSDINNTGAIPVVNGTANALTSWLLTSSVTTVGTDALTYSQFSLSPTATIAPTDYSSVSTVVGWSSFTIKEITYSRVNNNLIVWYRLQGTSNSTSVSFTVPYSTTNNGVALYFNGIGIAKDNGGSYTSGWIEVQANTSTINLYSTIAAGSWTASGTKDCRGSITIPIQ